MKQIWHSMCTGSGHGSGVQPRSVYKEFVADTAAVGHVVAIELGFLPPVSFHKHFIRDNSSTTDHSQTYNHNEDAVNTKVCNTPSYTKCSSS